MIHLSVKRAGRLIVFSVFFIVLSCGAAGQQAEDRLKESVVQFNEGIRWGRMQEVIPRVHPDNVQHFLKMHEHLEMKFKFPIMNLLAMNIIRRKSQLPLTFA